MFSKPKPTFKDFLNAYKDGILNVDNRADLYEGSIFEIVGGVASILWARQAQRDEDLFAAGLTSSAEGKPLTDRLQALTGTTRVLDSVGTGVAVLTRTSTSAGGGTFWEGTRIALVDRNGLTEATYAEVAEDTSVLASDIVATVPIRSLQVGNIAVTSSSNGIIYPRFDDIVWDTGWLFSSFSLGAGTTFEPAPEYRARAHTEQQSKRVGFETSILNACKAAGAERVALFGASYPGAGYDFGLNYVYVGDASYGTPSSLVGKCMLALESQRVLGDNMQIRPMQSSALTVKATVYLSDTPSKFNTSAIITRVQNVIASSVTSSFTYSRDLFRGAVFKSIEVVNDIDFTTPSADGAILSVNRTLPATLTRYTLRPQDVFVTLKGPR